MHPILAKPGRLLPYLAACAPLAAIVTALLARPGGLFVGEAIALAIPLTVAYAFIGLSPWYLCRQFPLKRARVLPLVMAHVLAGVLLAALWIGLAAVLCGVYELIPAFQGLAARFAAQAVTLLAAGFLLYLLSASLNYVLLALQAASEAERREAELEILAREAELAALRAQIRPHFLFNSLNSISALASSDPTKAQEMCVRLGEFLRKSLSVGERKTISVAEELALSRAYLQVEALRFGERLQFEEDLDERGDRCQLPPLLLQPLVENAVRHGVASRIEGGKVRVSVACSAGRLRILIENPLDPDAPSRPGTGVGLANVRQRLAAKWGPDGLFAAKRLADRYMVVISVPAEAAA
jgi:two-component system, LytTR family, sensor histidine kinase AlgZ